MGNRATQNGVAVEKANLVQRAKEDDLILAFGSLSYLGDLVREVHLRKENI